MLAANGRRTPEAPAHRRAERAAGRGAAKEPPSTFEAILKSPLTRSVANQLTRSLMGALLGPTRRRRY